MYNKDTKVGDTMTNVDGFPIGSIITCGKKTWISTKLGWDAFDLKLHLELPYSIDYTVQYLPETPPESLKVGRIVPAKELQNLPLGSIFSYKTSLGCLVEIIVTSEGPKNTYGTRFVSLDKFVTYLTYTLHYLPETSN